MGAKTLYSDFPPTLAWKTALKPSPSKRACKEIVLGPGYTRIMRDDCMMAAVFGYIRPLLEGILKHSLPCERENVLDLFRGDVCVTIRKGNLVIQAI